MAWRATNMLTRRVRAPEYLFELLALMAYQTAARRTGGLAPPLDDCYAEFLSMLESYRSLEVRWAAYYEPSAIPADVLQQRPLVLDPACPHCNVALQMPDDGWKVGAPIRIFPRASPPHVPGG